MSKIEELKAAHETSWRRIVNALTKARAALAIEAVRPPT